MTYQPSKPKKISDIQINFADLGNFKFYNFHIFPFFIVYTIKFYK